MSNHDMSCLRSDLDRLRVASPSEDVVVGVDPARARLRGGLVSTPILAS